MQEITGKTEMLTFSLYSTTQHTRHYQQDQLVDTCISQAGPSRFTKQDVISYPPHHSHYQHFKVACHIVCHLSPMSLMSYTSSKDCDTMETKSKYLHSLWQPQHATVSVESALHKGDRWKVTGFNLSKP